MKNAYERVSYFFCTFQFCASCTAKAPVTTTHTPACGLAMPKFSLNLQVILSQMIALLFAVLPSFGSHWDNILVVVASRSWSLQAFVDHD